MNVQLSFHKKVLHFKQPAGTSRGVYTTRTSWIVTAKDGAQPDVEGWGECAPLPDLSCDAMPDADYEATLTRMLKATEERGGIIDYEALRPYPSMLFGIETALLDLQNGGQRIVYDTPFTHGEEGIRINGLVWMGNFVEMLARLETKMQEGFHCVKLKIGAIDFQRELDLVRHIRSAFTKEQIELRLDANGGFAYEDAMDRLEQLARYDIHSIEQPIRQHQWQRMAELCKATPIPIALDEELIGVNTLSEKADLLDTIRPQYIILKPSLHGGIHGSEEWIRMANERGIGSWITSALESNIGLNAVAQFAARMYPDASRRMPQGLGTGMLFTDNIDMPLQIKGDRLWRI